LVDIPCASASVVAAALRESAAAADVANLQKLALNAALLLEAAVADADRLNWLDANFIRATDNNVYVPACIYWGRGVSLRQVIDRELTKLRR
jgi:hypothetical protein